MRHARHRGLLLNRLVPSLDGASCCVKVRNSPEMPTRRELPKGVPRPDMACLPSVMRPTCACSSTPICCSATRCGRRRAPGMTCSASSPTGWSRPVGESSPTCGGDEPDDVDGRTVPGEHQPAPLRSVARSAPFQLRRSLSSTVRAAAFLGWSQIVDDDSGHAHHRLEGEARVVAVQSLQRL